MVVMYVIYFVSCEWLHACVVCVLCVCAHTHSTCVTYKGYISRMKWSYIKLHDKRPITIRRTCVQNMEWLYLFIRILKVSSKKFILIHTCHINICTSPSHVASLYHYYHCIILRSGLHTCSAWFLDINMESI